MSPAALIDATEAPAPFPAPIYLVGPYALVMAYAGAFFRRTTESDGLTIGAPIAEAVGVPNRRAMVAHPLTVLQLAYAARVLAANNHAELVSLDDAPPDDWRVPASPAPTRPPFTGAGGA